MGEGPRNSQLHSSSPPSLPSWISGRRDHPASSQLPRTLLPQEAAEDSPSWPRHHLELCFITGGLCCAIRLGLRGTGSVAPAGGALPHRTAAQRSSGGRVLGSEPGTAEALRYACLPTCLGHRDRQPDGRQGSLWGYKGCSLGWRMKEKKGPPPFSELLLHTILPH